MFISSHPARGETRKVNDNDFYLADLPSESNWDGFKKDPLLDNQGLLAIQSQGSNSALDTTKPSQVLSGTGRGSNTEVEELVDSPLSNNFKPIQKYMNKYHSPNLQYCGKLDCQYKSSIFKTCGQIQPIPIRVIAHPLNKLRKIGEGTFGEVYIGHFKSSTRSRIFKVVAIEGKKLVNDQIQRKFGEMEPEIIVSKHLNKLRKGYKGCYSEGFVYLHHARICQGKYPTKLMNAWRSFKYLGGCENTQPDYCDTQFYVVFEYDYCGVDICSYHFNTQKQALSIILQVAYSLAAAESACEFEHRDLHWGNVLIQQTKNKHNVYTIDNKTYRIPCIGLTSTIIDFSNSRITTEDNKSVFFDLANDEEQFTGPEKVQFDVYKRMRRMTRNKWHRYTPKSNVLWIHYLTTKFLKDVSYTNIASDEHYEYTKIMRKLRSGLLKYQSCTECAEVYLPQFTSQLERTTSD